MVAVYNTTLTFATEMRGILWLWIVSISNAKSSFLLNLIVISKTIVMGLWK